MCIRDSSTTVPRAGRLELDEKVPFWHVWQNITVYKQSAKSPELNRLDLGVWRMLHFAVLRHWKKFLDYTDQQTCFDLLWGIIEEEFWKLDPAKLYCISEHQIDIAKQVKRVGGRKLKIEAHGGARRRTAKDIEAAQYDSSDGERE